MGDIAPELLGEAPPGYAGDVSPREVWRMLECDPHAQLVDVRTAAEWTFVGGPDLTALNKCVVMVEWQIFPAMQRNEQFLDSVKAQLARIGADGTDSTAAIYFLCRSGVRSAAAARLASRHGMTRAYNVAAGFEGDRDSRGHRGTINGWKVDALAWTQK